MALAYFLMASSASALPSYELPFQPQYSNAVWPAGVISLPMSTTCWHQRTLVPFFVCTSFMSAFCSLERPVLPPQMETTSMESGMPLSWL